jgi:hypothetical protein
MAHPRLYSEPYERDSIVSVAPLHDPHKHVLNKQVRVAVPRVSPLGGGYLCTRRRIHHRWSRSSIGKPPR